MSVQHCEHCPTVSEKKKDVILKYRTLFSFQTRKRTGLPNGNCLRRRSPFLRTVVHDVSTVGLCGLCGYVKTLMWLFEELHYMKKSSKTTNPYVVLAGTKKKFAGRNSPGAHESDYQLNCAPLLVPPSLYYQAGPTRPQGILHVCRCSLGTLKNAKPEGQRERSLGSSTLALISMCPQLRTEKSSSRMVKICHLTLPMRIPSKRLRENFMFTDASMPMMGSNTRSNALDKIYPSHPELKRRKSLCPHH